MKWELYRPFGATVKAGQSWKCGECEETVFCGTEAAKEHHDATVHGLTVIWEIQTGKGASAYKTVYSFPSSERLHNSRAWLHYSSLNTDTYSGYKKRLRRRYPLTGEVTIVHREL